MTARIPLLENVPANVCFADVETSTKNKGNPHTASNFLVSHAHLFQKQTNFSYYTDPDLCEQFKKDLEQIEWLVGVNLKFDVQWWRRAGINIPDHIQIWDCSLAEHIMSGQTTIFPSMDSMCEQYGIKGKEGGLHEYWDNGISTENIPIQIVKDYNIADLHRTREVFLYQLSDPRMTQKIFDFVLLDGADMLVLADMEYNGIKYNLEGSKALADTHKIELAQIDKFLYEVAGTTQINLDSNDDLSCMLFGGKIVHPEFEEVQLVYKSGPRKGQEYTRNKLVKENVLSFPGFFTPVKGSELKKQGYYSTADGVLKQLKCRSKIQRSIIEKLQRRAELSKVVGTYLDALPKLIETMEWVEYLHGQFNQVMVATGRLSSSKP